MQKQKSIEQNYIYLVDKNLTRSYEARELNDLMAFQAEDEAIKFINKRYIEVYLKGNQNLDDLADQFDQHFDLSKDDPVSYENLNIAYIIWFSHSHKTAPKSFNHWCYQHNFSEPNYSDKDYTDCITAAKKKWHLKNPLPESFWYQLSLAFPWRKMPGFAEDEQLIKVPLI